MTKKQICEMFTQKVSEYINKGYIITPDSFAGSDGTSRVDLVKGSSFIRIYLTEEWSDNKNSLFLRVGEMTLTGYSKSRAYSHDIVWLTDLTTIEETKFIIRGKYTRNPYYLTEGEYEEMREKLEKRDSKRMYSFMYESVSLPEDAKKVVLPFIQRQHRCKSVKLKDINRVEKVIREDRVRYRVYCKGHVYVLN